MTSRALANRSIYNGTAASLSLFLKKLKNGIHLPYLRCKDGFVMSVQYGKGFYSLVTRQQMAIQVEVGYPSEVEELLLKYQESPADQYPTNDVYHNVPIRVLRDIVEKHGGLDYGAIGSDKEENERRRNAQFIDWGPWNNGWLAT